MAGRPVGCVHSVRPLARSREGVRPPQTASLPEAAPQWRASYSAAGMSPSASCSRSVLRHLIQDNAASPPRLRSWRCRGRRRPSPPRGRCRARRGGRCSARHVYCEPRPAPARCGDLPADDPTAVDIQDQGDVGQSPGTSVRTSGRSPTGGSARAPRTRAAPDPGPGRQHRARERCARAAAAHALRASGICGRSTPQPGVLAAEPRVSLPSRRRAPRLQSIQNSRAASGLVLAIHRGKLGR
jgi:hypothetical protein